MYSHPAPESMSNNRRASLHTNKRKDIIAVWTHGMGVVCSGAFVVWIDVFQP